MRSVEAAIAVARFGMGAKPGEIRTAASDPRGYLLEQTRRPDAAIYGRDLPDTIQLVAEHRDYVRVSQAKKRASESAAAENTMAGGSMAGGMEKGMRAQKTPQPKQPPFNTRYLEGIQARFAHAITTADGFIERLALFWSNHFAVDIGKSATIRIAAPAYEREAIRPHVLGRFEDMLIAVEQHPVMLFYLDNISSIGPNSRAGKRRGRGLNENLAREIMELHTLGVDGGYTQADVVELAKALTGWSVGNDLVGENLGAFRFRKFWHEPGYRTVLGHDFRAGEVEQGEAILRFLARQPATARHLAVKLARHFIADDPPPAAVARLERAYLDSEGDLKAVAMALVETPEAWDPQPRKLKTPYEFVVSAARALGLPTEANYLFPTMNVLGQPVFDPPSPAGFADREDAWAAPDSIKSRLDWSAWMARIYGAREPVRLAEDVLGGYLSPRTREGIARAETTQQATALLLMSPEFQRR